MRTLEDLRQRCVIDESDPHSCWRFAPTRIYAPLHRGSDTLTAMQPRRASWVLAHGMPIKKGYRAFSTCGHPQCVNPNHIHAVLPSVWGGHVAKTGKLKGRPAKIAANRAIGRKRSKLTPEQIQEAMTSPEAGQALAARWGVSETTVSKARRGCMVSYASQTNPWAGLMR